MSIYGHTSGNKEKRNGMKKVGTDRLFYGGHRWPVASRVVKIDKLEFFWYNSIIKLIFSSPHTKLV